MVDCESIDYSGDPPFFDAAYSSTTGSEKLDLIAEENIKACFTSKCKRLECTSVKSAEEMDCGINNLSLLLLQSKCRVLKKTFHERVSLSDCRQVGGKGARWVLKTHPEIKHFGLISNGAIDISLSESNRGVFAIDGEVFFAIISMISKKNLLERFRADVMASLKHFAEPKYESDIALEAYESSICMNQTSLKKAESEIKFVVAPKIFSIYDRFGEREKDSVLETLQEAIYNIRALQDLASGQADLDDTYRALFYKRRRC